MTATEDDCYFGASPAINIVKFANGQDANSPTGPIVPVGSTVTFTYVVTNTGNVPLANVTVTDDKLGPIAGPASGDTNSNGLLDLTETWTYTKTATALAGQQTNVGTTTGTGAGQTVTDTDPANYFGAAPALTLVKRTNGTDNACPTGPVVPVGSTVTWTYEVTNTGNVTLTNILVVDDNGTPGNTADDVTVGTIATLAPGATATLTRTGTAVAGYLRQHRDRPSTSIRRRTGARSTVSATEDDCYFGASPGINIVKFDERSGREQPDRPDRAGWLDGDLDVCGDQHGQCAAGECDRDRRQARPDRGSGVG